MPDFRFDSKFLHPFEPVSLDSMREVLRMERITPVQLTHVLEEGWRLLVKLGKGFFLAHTQPDCTKSHAIASNGELNSIAMSSSVVKREFSAQSSFENTGGSSFTKRNERIKSGICCRDESARARLRASSSHCALEPLEILFSYICR